MTGEVFEKYGRYVKLIIAVLLLWGLMWQKDNVDNNVHKIINNTFIHDVIALKVGSSVYFGRYYQDSINEKEPIEWRILDIEDDKILLMSEYGLDAKAYNKEHEDTSWGNCTLRNWLNQDFIVEAFTNDEQKSIILSKLITNDEKTEDKVFLLSSEAAEKYFDSNEDRMCKPTKFAINHGAYQNKDNGQCWWWLRSLGNRSLRATYVYADGWVYSHGPIVNRNHGSVRPALWINLKS